MYYNRGCRTAVTRPTVITHLSQEGVGGGSQCEISDVVQESGAGFGVVRRKGFSPGLEVWRE